MLIVAFQVILGFSVTAYLTLLLLILHYVTVYDPRRVSSRGKAYTNPVDRDILTYLRERVITYSPSRRFEVAMEKSVLILSDAQLVTGLAILISGYSQLNCGITAYHWQIMVFIAWFSSFTYLSSMTFLIGYFQTNNSMRMIRICFMFILASLLITALLPTGSDNWLDLTGAGGDFYPSLSALCYFKQLTKDSYSHGGPRIWSMVFSVLVVSISYIHSGIRLFDPTSELTRKYLRAWPGHHIKRLLHFLERRSRKQGFWKVPYLLVFAFFTSARVSCDLVASMLVEIIWLTFAIVWGTIKVWDTRASAGYNTERQYVGANGDVLEEDSWSFGQTLPLVLLLLPLLSMAQAYLDNEAKAHGDAKATGNNIKAERNSTLHPTELSSIHIGESPQDTIPNPRNSTSCSLSRCNHDPSLYTAQSHTPSISVSKTSFHTPHRPTHSPHSTSRSPRLPQHPYGPFTRYPWYADHVLLLLMQILFMAGFALFLLNILSNFLGISAILRNRVFLYWILAMIPAASFLHLSIWYVAGWVVNALGCEAWLKGYPKEEGEEGERDRGAVADTKEPRWWKRPILGLVVYWSLRMALVNGLVVFTFFVTLEVAGPEALAFNT